ncbi:putative serine protease 45 [Manis pentadactyla]|uniref:putative serine protease 45 n=1 Tax=Manis pentadactyla TaxID=143292 RepID=UPI00255C7C24|nr:putative serine protease 45 [Manis pentadactyla]
MAAWLCSLRTGAGASTPWRLTRRLLLLLLLLLLPLLHSHEGSRGDKELGGGDAMLLRSVSKGAVSLDSLQSSGHLQTSLLNTILTISLGIRDVPCVQAAPEVSGKPWWSEDLDVTRHWPWVVSLQVEDEHMCGGALIDPSWVVTATHCIQGTDMYTTSKSTSKLKPTDGMKALVIPVKDIIMHPKYWGRTFTMGDVALLQLHTPAVLSKYVQPICLPEPSYTLKVGTQCWVTGWGQEKQRFSVNSTLTPELQEAEVFIMDSKRCDRIHHKKSIIPHTVPLVLRYTICDTSYGENLCAGDSGGPLACEVEGKWILAGVLSLEKACTKVPDPGVYACVTKYSKWIKKQISSGALAGPCTSAWLLLLSWLLWPQMDL